MKLFDYINAINSTKKPLLDTEDEQVEKGFLRCVDCVYVVE